MSAGSTPVFGTMDYEELYKKTWFIQHKIAHLALNLTVRAGSKKIPAPERDRLKKIADKMFDLAKMHIDPPGV